MTDYTRFYCLAEDLAKGEHDLETDNLTLLLTNVAPDLAATTTADLTEIAATGGYTAGGKTILGRSMIVAAGVVRLTADPVTWTAGTGGLGPVRYGVIYNDTNDKLICFVDNGISVTIPDGSPLTFTFDAAEGFLKIE